MECGNCEKVDYCYVDCRICLNCGERVKNVKLQGMITSSLHEIRRSIKRNFEVVKKLDEALVSLVRKDEKRFIKKYKEMSKLQWLNARLWQMEGNLENIMRSVTRNVMVRAS